MGNLFYIYLHSMHPSLSLCLCLFSLSIQASFLEPAQGFFKLSFY